MTMQRADDRASEDRHQQTSAARVLVVDDEPHIVDFITLAMDQGSREVIGIALMAGGELARPPGTWGELMGRTGGSQDHRDAVAAFVAKQRPVFHGR